MKTVAIYNASWHTFGGGEKYICELADALSKEKGFRVSLLVDKPLITKDTLRRYFNLDLATVSVTNVLSQEIHSVLSGADIGVVVSNFRSFGCQAKRNIYVLQIPYPAITPTRTIAKFLRGEWRETGKDFFRRDLINTARSASEVLVYSEFVRNILRENHGINAHVLYPPIEDFSTGEKKENMILSVGRFFRGPYNDKRYDIQIEAFKRLRTRLPHTSWTYHLVGSCPSDGKSQRYLEELRAAAVGHPIYLHVNAPYDELRRYYGQASIFWHAAGYDVDEKRHPERTEHFGMSTVEAMSAGCIPVVANKGGQKEIVSHGQSGYLWDTLDELVHYTANLINNPEQQEILRHHARERFLDFDQRHFSDRLITLFKQLDND